MGQQFYYTSQFARKASVTVRTLRYYDKEGLLSPTSVTDGGYRLYSDSDFLRLQQILALKFLGFSLDEIRVCLHVGPRKLQESLALQKAMLCEKREQLDTILQAIEQTQELLQANTQDWDAIVHVIQVIQMTQNNDWVSKYFTDEQRQQMEALSEQSYTPEQRQQIAEWGKNWSEADQQGASQRWNEIFVDLNQLVATGADPTGPAAQAFIQRWMALVGEFTHGDTGITQGLKNMYGSLKKIPAEQRPFSYPYNEEGEAFLGKAIAAYNEKQ